MKITSEYDHQVVVEAILRLHYENVRREEDVPSLASSSSRMDFLIKDHSILVECKMTCRTLSAREIRDGLIVDCAPYRRHPGCAGL